MLAFFSLFLVPSFCRAQDVPIFRARTDLVVVPVSVTDGAGRFVFGLTRDQIELSEEGSRRTVTQISAERAPVSLGILLDISSSMSSDPKTSASEDARWADTQRALEVLVTRLDPRDEVLFAVFNENVSLATAWTQDHTRVLRALTTVRPSGTTALFSAVRSLAPAFQMAQHQRKVLMIISDGQDTTVPVVRGAPVAKWPLTPQQQLAAQIFEGHRAARTAVVGATTDAVNASGAILYAIGVGTQKGAEVNLDNLESLTKNTGGYVQELREPSEIAGAVARMCDDLQAQYLVAFEPAHTDGRFHAISIRVKGRRVNVRTRAGYLANKN